MKNKNYLFLLLLFPLLFSCNNEDDTQSPSANVGVLSIYVGFTNDKGVDFVEKAPKITKENCQLYFPEKDTWSGGKFGGKQVAIKFDSWQTYLDGKLINSSAKDITYSITLLSNGPDSENMLTFKGFQCIPLCGQDNIELDIKQNDTFSDLHNIEHHIVSEDLFGNTDIHVLTVQFKHIPPKQRFNYQITLDGNKMEVYYPQEWALEPAASEGDVKYGDEISPVFLINVDKLN